MGYEDEECPLCVEEFDDSDRGFQPCPCGYKICTWCVHHIQESLNGLCPACRQPFDESKFVYADVTPRNRIKKKISDRPREEGETTGDLSALKDARVVLKTLVYIMGIPETIANDATLRKTTFFGQYGPITKLAVNRSASYHGPHPTFCAYVTYQFPKDALACIRDVDGAVFEGRMLRAEYGTAKYCSYFLREIPCRQVNCAFLHELCESTDEMYSSKERFIEQRHQQQKDSYLRLPAGSLVPEQNSDALKNSAFGKVRPPPPGTIKTIKPPPGLITSSLGSAPVVDTTIAVATVVPNSFTPPSAPPSATVPSASTASEAKRWNVGWDAPSASPTFVDPFNIEEILKQQQADKGKKKKPISTSVLPSPFTSGPLPSSGPLPTCPVSTANSLPTGATQNCSSGVVSLSNFAPTKPAPLTGIGFPPPRTIDNFSAWGVPLHSKEDMSSPNGAPPGLEPPSSSDLPPGLALDPQDAILDLSRHYMSGLVSTHTTPPRAASKESMHANVLSGEGTVTGTEVGALDTPATPTPTPTPPPGTLQQQAVSKKEKQRLAQLEKQQKAHQRALEKAEADAARARQLAEQAAAKKKKLDEEAAARTAALAEQERLAAERKAAVEEAKRIAEEEARRIIEAEEKKIRMEKERFEAEERKKRDIEEAALKKKAEEEAAERKKIAAAEEEKKRKLLQEEERLKKEKDLLAQMQQQQQQQSTQVASSTSQTLGESLTASVPKGAEQPQQTATITAHEDSINLIQSSKQQQCESDVTTGKSVMDLNNESNTSLPLTIDVASTSNGVQNASVDINKHRSSSSLLPSDTNNRQSIQDSKQQQQHQAVLNSSNSSSNNNNGSNTGWPSRLLQFAQQQQHVNSNNNNPNAHHSSNMMLSSTSENTLKSPVSTNPLLAPPEEDEEELDNNNKQSPSSPLQQQQQQQQQQQFNNNISSLHQQQQHIIIPGEDEAQRRRLQLQSLLSSRQSPNVVPHSSIMASPSQISHEIPSPLAHPQFAASPVMHHQQQMPAHLLQQHHISNAVATHPHPASGGVMMPSHGTPSFAHSSPQYENQIPLHIQQQQQQQSVSTQNQQSSATQAVGVFGMLRKLSNNPAATATTTSSATTTATINSNNNNNPHQSIANPLTQQQQQQPLHLNHQQSEFPSEISPPMYHFPPFGGLPSHEVPPPPQMIPYHPGGPVAFPHAPYGAPPPAHAAALMQHPSSNQQQLPTPQEAAEFLRRNPLLPSHLAPNDPEYIKYRRLQQLAMGINPFNNAPLHGPPPPPAAHHHHPSHLHFQPSPHQQVQTQQVQQVQHQPPKEDALDVLKRMMPRANVALQRSQQQQPQPQSQPPFNPQQQAQQQQMGFYNMPPHLHQQQQQQGQQPVGRAQFPSNFGSMSALPPHYASSSPHDMPNYAPPPANYGPPSHANPASWQNSQQQPHRMGAPQGFPPSNYPPLHHDTMNHQFNRSAAAGAIQNPPSQSYHHQMNSALPPHHMHRLGNSMYNPQLHHHPIAGYPPTSNGMMSSPSQSQQQPQPQHQSMY